MELPWLPWRAGLHSRFSVIRTELFDELPHAAVQPTIGQKQCRSDPKLDERLAARDGDGRSVRVARQWIGQHHISRRQFRWSRSLQGHLLAELLHGIFLHRRRDQGGPDRSWRYRVRTDALAGQHLRQSASESEA